jgi:hypothetical protein
VDGNEERKFHGSNTPAPFGSVIGRWGKNFSWNTVFG